MVGRLDTLVLTGTIGSFLRKKRVYLAPYNGVTFYSTLKTQKRLSISAVEVPKIDKGPLDL